VEEQRLLTPDSPSESDEQAAYLRWMVQTGRRLAEMQLALASHPEIDDFRPMPIEPDDVRSWTEGVLTRAERVFEDLVRRHAQLKDTDLRMADSLLAYRDTLGARLGQVLPEHIEARKIRHHGDFHLGQMLIVRDDVYIIDFEGEPRRSLAERRLKAPAARDVAGLIRSIDYSATAAFERAMLAGPDEHGRIAAGLEDWRLRSIATFLDAYRETLGNHDLWPKDRDAADRLLDFFLLEKAFYEIEYELSHRPDRLRVPLAGALRILSRHAGVGR
jgi:maltose alpha-D-glucosyltransferase/alpha-amylase